MRHSCCFSFLSTACLGVTPVYRVEDVTVQPEPATGRISLSQELIWDALGQPHTWAPG